MYNLLSLKRKNKCSLLTTQNGVYLPTLAALLLDLTPRLGLTEEMTLIAIRNPVAPLQFSQVQFIYVTVLVMA